MINIGPRRRMQMPVDFDTEPKSEVDKALHSALQAKMREIVEKPLTPRNLVELGQIAEIGRSLIIIGKMPAAGAPLGNNDSVTWQSSSYVSPMLNLGLGYEDNPMFSSPPAETFGATAIREIVAAVGKMTEKRERPEEIVGAIAAARDAGLHELAKKLEENLLRETPKTAAIPSEPPPTLTQGDT